MHAGRSRGLIRLGVVLTVAYAAVLLASPLLHHDVACHVKTPSHCTGCQASPQASLVGVGVPIPAPTRTLVVTLRPASDPREFLQGRRLSGRAPPA